MGVTYGADYLVLASSVGAVYGLVMDGRGTEVRCLGSARDNLVRTVLWYCKEILHYLQQHVSTIKTLSSG